MTFVFGRFVAPVVLALVLLSCSPTPSGPARIVVADAWTKATPAGAAVGAGYMTIRNEGGAAARLVGGEASVAERVEVHTMAMEGGVMSMRPVEGGLEVPPGGEVALKPGGLHLMLVGLKQPFAEGESVSVTLIFEGGMRVETTLAVRAMGGGHDH
jgi:hypothetical protein